MFTRKEFTHKERKLNLLRLLRQLTLPRWLATFALILYVGFLGSCDRSNLKVVRLDTIWIDYAYYSPVSLALKGKHWLEEKLTENVKCGKNGNGLCKIRISESNK
ncbi:MAG: hypothetical protein KME13_19935 [Myxacorys californica WJT36-NPBG1]|jgi:hypothetical protein|nr:hypothetical protein [Myxacorys californica WJT36-NPBG1]